METIFKLMLAQLTPAILDGVREGVKMLHAKALSTSNPYDDMATSVLATLVGADISGVKAEPAA